MQKWRDEEIGRNLKRSVELRRAGEALRRKGMKPGDWGGMEAEEVDTEGEK